MKDSWTYRASILFSSGGGSIFSEQEINNMPEIPSTPKFTQFFPVKIREYAGEIFSTIREKENLSDTGLMASLSPENNSAEVFKVGEGEGKSGSFFFHTFDHRYIIKAITSQEVATLLRVIPGLALAFTEREGSVIVPVYGVFRVKMPRVVPVHFVLLRNTLPALRGFVFIYIYIYIIRD